MASAPAPVRCRSHLHLVLYVVVVLQAAVLCPVASAWYRAGHMLTAQVAEPRLSPQARAACEALLGTDRSIEPNLLALPSSTRLPLTATSVVEAAYWPDAIRPLGFYEYGPWHYIDLPLVRVIPANASQVHPQPPPATDNVLWAVEMGAATLRRPDVSPALKSAALRFVLHFVGDIHQPLHTASLYSMQFPNGDGGGNAFRVTGSSAWHNLHGLWDSAAGEFNWFDKYHYPIDLATVASVAANLTTTYPSHPQYVPGGTNVTRWVCESHELAASVGYEGITPGGEASAAYVAKARTTCNSRIVLGGWRLADLLNDVFRDGYEAPDRGSGGVPASSVVGALLGGVLVGVLLMWAERRWRGARARKRLSRRGGYRGHLMGGDDGGAMELPPVARPPTAASAGGSAVLAGAAGTDGGVGSPVPVPAYRAPGPVGTEAGAGRSTGAAGGLDVEDVSVALNVSAGDQLGGGGARLLAPSSPYQAP